MADHILRTKLHVPPARANTVPRPHLVEQLNAGLQQHHKLTIISASAGSGKTTLLGEWASSCNQHFAWLSLDQEDSDPSRFWTYVIHALQTLHPQIGKTVLPFLRESQPAPVQSLLTPVLNEMALLTERLVLVLDDYHLVSSQAIDGRVTFLIDHAPEQLHLVISTRADPPLPLARLRARGQLTELRDDDLCFSTEEARTFLNDVIKLNLPSEDIAALKARTEGWISGLHLAALSMQGRQDTHAFVETFTGSHHYVIDYLVEEVVSRQSESVQRFLLQTSILDRLCAPLCNALPGEQNGAAMLEQLQRSNLFVIPLDDERHWFRYHHLFSDLLRKRLGQAMSSEHIAELHRRASRWHEDNNLLEQAVKHARAAGDDQRIAEIAEQAAGDSLLDARLTTLLRWVDTLPKDTLLAHPRLQIYRAWALYMNGHLEAAQQNLRDCRRGLENLPPSPENDRQRRTLTRLLDIIEMVAQGFVLSMDNRIPDAIQICRQARDMALEDGQVFLAAQATEGLALAQYHQGRLRDSAQSCQQVIDLATGGGASAPLAAAGYVELAGIHTEWNRLESAADLLDKALSLCHRWGIIQTLSEAYTAQSRVLQASGQIQEASEALENARQASCVEGSSSVVNFRLAAQQARLHLHAGKLDRVLRWVEETQTTLASSQGRFPVPAAFPETLQTLLAQVHLAQGKAQEALDDLEPLLRRAEDAGAFLRVVEVCALKALSLQALGDTSAALGALKHSLALAEPEHHVRTFVDKGAPMARLLSEAASRGIHQDYTHRLLVAFTDPKSAHTTGKSLPDKSLANPVISDPLTPRERDVLNLINQGLSNKDIADELVIALNTVKRHTSSIYDKLAVKSRTQAIARGRELGLLSTDRE